MESITASFIELEDWIRWGAPVAVTLIIGLAAALIGRGQWLTAKAKVKLDLFDRRWAVYLAYVRFLQKAVKEGYSNESLMDWLRDTQTAYFLFDKDIDAYRGLVWEKYQRLVNLELQSKPGKENPALDQNAIQNEITELKLWMTHQLGGGIRNAFVKYLSFAKWS